MKKYLLTSTVVLLSMGMFAQNVKFKNDKIFVDKEHVLTYAMKGNDFTLFNLEGKELIFIFKNVNGTPNRTVDDFKKITFLEYNIVVYRKGESGAKYEIRKMIQNGTISSDGNVTKEKAEAYKAQFEEEDKILRRRY